MLRLSLLVVLALVFASTQAIDCGPAKSHNSSFGKRVPGDSLMYMDTPKHESKFLRVVEADVRFPFKNDYPKGVISYIEIQDQYTNGNGGCTYITEGGVGQTFVNIHIKSQRNHGYNFIVKVYGRPGYQQTLPVF